MRTTNLPTTETTQPVVMVDDSYTDILLAQLCYEDACRENPFVSMSSGAQLLEYLDAVEAGTAVMPAIVLLDINMPAMNGFDVLEAVRRREAFARVPPIVMFTHSDDPGDERRAAELGAHGYRTKPFTVAEYVEFFETLN